MTVEALLICICSLSFAQSTAAQLSGTVGKVLIRIRDRGNEQQLAQVQVQLIRFPESKITTPVLGWRQDSVIRSDNRDFGVAESFSTCADIWIVW